MLGTYGAPLSQSGAFWPIEGFNGADADPGNEVVPFGIRHMVAGQGLWLQPEPLLYLGLTNGDLESPRAYSGMYAAANPVLFADRTGHFTVGELWAGWKTGAHIVGGVMSTSARAIAGATEMVMNPSTLVEGPLFPKDVVAENIMQSAETAEQGA